MTTTDIILLALFIPAVWQGLSKGLINQVIGIASLFLAAWLANKFSIPAADALAGQFTKAQPQVLKIGAFVVIFLVTILAAGLLGKLITKIIKFATLGWINRLLGLLFGIIKTALILGLLICLFDSLNSKWGMIKQETLSGSVVYDYLKDFGMKFFPFLKSLVTKGNA